MRFNLKTIPAIFRDGAVSLFFPTRCRVCGALIERSTEAVGCHACWAALHDNYFHYDHCPKCDAFLTRLTKETQQRWCGHCEALAFTTARSGGQYAGALRESIVTLKSQPYLSPQVILFLTRAFERLPNHQQIEAILPVPLHPTREKWRGYNQATLIAERLAHQTDLPVYRQSLIRVLATERHRAGMDARERAQSLQGVFEVRAARGIQNKKLLVVDDVMTTGTTASEISETLLTAGAQSVSFLTLARAMHFFQ